MLIFLTILILSTPFILIAAIFYSFYSLEKEDLKRDIENKKNFGISNEEFWNRCGWDKTVLKEWTDEIRKNEMILTGLYSKIL